MDMFRLHVRAPDPFKVSGIQIFGLNSLGSTTVCLFMRKCLMFMEMVPRNTGLVCSFLLLCFYCY